MKFRRRCRLLNRAPDAVSLGGVFFLLLFFSLMRSPGVGVGLPRLKEAELLPPGPVEAVGIRADGSVWYRNLKIIDDLKVTSDPETEPGLRFLETSLRQQRERTGENLAVLLKADRGLDYGKIMRIVRLAREAGVRRIWLATEPGLLNPDD